MQRITAKDISQKLNISLCSATQLRKDIKEHYKPKSNIITLNHLIDYLNIPKI